MSFMEHQNDGGTMDEVDIIKLIKTASQCGVKKLKYRDLEVDFVITEVMPKPAMDQGVSYSTDTVKDDEPVYVDDDADLFLDPEKWDEKLKAAKDGGEL
jgi:hypothetical protein